MRFIGKVVTQWHDNDRDMIIGRDFGFMDSTGYTWWARRGDVIDGASIPRVAWITTGPPYTGKYRRAAVLHDSGYIWKTRPRKEVDRMFLAAMKLAGVSLVKRWKMYLAVRAFGAKPWEDCDFAEEVAEKDLII